MARWRSGRAVAQTARFIVALIDTDYDRVFTRVETALTRLGPVLQELAVSADLDDGDSAMEAAL